VAAGAGAKPGRWVRRREQRGAPLRFGYPPPAASKMSNDPQPAASHYTRGRPTRSTRRTETALPWSTHELGRRCASSALDTGLAWPTLPIRLALGSGNPGDINDFEGRPRPCRVHLAVAVRDETRADTPDPNLTNFETAALAALSAEPGIYLCLEQERLPPPFIRSRLNHAMELRARSGVVVTSGPCV
jgi:hypothetical protein